MESEVRRPHYERVVSDERNFDVIGKELKTLNESIVYTPCMPIYV